jgi:phage internal scaffolding protein
MSFHARNDEGQIIKHKPVKVICNEETITEQHHKTKVDVNSIMARHNGSMRVMAQIANLSNYQFDDVTNNDFQESMNIVAKAKTTFENLPSKIRTRFENDPAKFMDFISDKNNVDEMVELGLAVRTPEEQPINVNVVNQNNETNTITDPGDSPES